VLGQPGHEAAFGGCLERQVGADEAARNGVQLVAPLGVGWSAAHLEQRGLQQLVQRRGRLRSTRRQQPRAVGRGGEDGQRGEQLAGGR
jgi:hypothetical protein